MWPGKLGKFLSSPPGAGQEQRPALLSRELGHAQVRGAAGHRAQCNRGAALPLTTGTKPNHHFQCQA